MEALDDILTELVRREPIFHRAEFPTVMAEGYWEIGASGQRYDREFILRHLAENPPVDASEAGWGISEAEVQHLAEDTFLLTYTLNQQPRLSRRATVWRRASGGWKIVYHQGTLMSGEGGLSSAKTA